MVSIVSSAIFFWKFDLGEDVASRRAVSAWGLGGEMSEMPEICTCTRHQ